MEIEIRYTQPRDVDTLYDFFEAYDAEPADSDRTELIGSILQQARISYDLKTEVMRAVRKYNDPLLLMAELHTLPGTASLRGPLLEIQTSC